MFNPKFEKSNLAANIKCQVGKNRHFYDCHVDPIPSETLAGDFYNYHLDPIPSWRSTTWITSLASTWIPSLAEDELRCWDFPQKAAACILLPAAVNAFCVEKKGQGH